MSRPLFGLTTAAVVSLFGLAVAAAAEPDVQVTYQPPHLSVRARDASLPIVLRQIGGQVGFAVETADVPYPAVSVSLSQVPVEEALRQLLRGQDHAIVYREQAGVPVIDVILLRGAQTAKAPGSGAPVPPAVKAPGTATLAPPAVSSAVPAAAPPPTRSPAAVASPPWRDAEASSIPSAAAVPAVEDILKSHAYSAAPFAPPPEASSPSAAPPAANTEDALRTLTGTAQQNLKALMDALGTATDSLRSSGAIPPR